MKVLMVGPDRSVHGGISAMVNNYYLAGLDKRIELKYIGTMKEGSKLKKLITAACAYVDYITSLHNYEIVHIHVASDNSFRRKSWFIRAAHRHHKRIIIHQHGGDFKNYHDKLVSPGTRNRMDEILNMADELLVLTPSWKDYFSHIVTSDRITVLPNGVIPPAQTVSSPAADDKRIRNILFLGRICVAKGVNELLDAVIALHDEYPDINLYLGGIFESRTEGDIALRSRIENAPGYVHYLGWIQDGDKNEYLRKCGILALPSHFEGFGLVLIEGMSYGNVVIGSDVGGIPETIDDGINGLLFVPGNIKDLTDKLRTVMTDRDLTERIIQNALKTVNDKYSMDVIVTQLLNIYQNTTRA